MVIYDRFKLQSSMLRLNKRISCQLILLSFLFLFGCSLHEKKRELKVRAEVTNLIEKFSELQNNGKGKEAIRYLDFKSKELGEFNSLENWYIYFNKTMYYLKYENNTDKASLYLDSLQTTLTRLDKSYGEEYGRTFFAKGDVHLAQKRFNEAFKNYYDGREYAAKNFDECKISNYTSQLGSVKLKQQQYSEAINYFKQALKENQACESEQGFNYQFVRIQHKMNAIAMVYEIDNQLDSAVVYYQKAIKFIKETNPQTQKDIKFAKAALGVVCGNLGGTYLKLGNYEKAEPMLLQSIAINDNPGYEVILINQILGLMQQLNLISWLKF